MKETIKLSGTISTNYIKLKKFKTNLRKTLFFFVSLFLLGQWLLKSCNFFFRQFFFSSLCSKLLTESKKRYLFSIFLVNAIKYFQQPFSYHGKIRESRSAPGKIQLHNGLT
ncbi:hypothetical protein ACJIZ3_018223 [Penstemon smallii]|uniref:Uncharacterized protein n=1 Tax=Penstemon smallii TaxID=265156 RepID=A0ABD3SYK6_9LAMI